ncbi:CDP-glucose 4,6-dehydratase [Microvirga antarctica]|uniref:CDP-glucose 4,6-dehydratase n=1 Tax=Microvirga antarctica TaxID=2819233 RepID=UPI001B314987|nr:CDP-glucose 4,6-dehydratase [Microvirga antarctica]
MSGEALDRDLWKGRRVLLTGHTGFKGAWMAMLLARLGATVTGLSLPAQTSPNLFGLLSPWSDLASATCDIRNPALLNEAIRTARPDIVIHMAAQALVMEAYADPVGTIASNVMGTVNLLEGLRTSDAVSAVLVITSDKVYENREAGIDFAESAALGGHDPYSASKAAAEILTSAYRRSFFAERGIPVVTARAGNVIGGGDWAPDRLLPDLFRAHESGRPVFMRNPDAVRPWQHVLDPLYGYLLYIQRCLSAPAAAPTSVNFGPPREPVRTVMEVAEQVSASFGADSLWTCDTSRDRLHESRFLSIDSALAKTTLGWSTALPVDEAIGWTVAWYKAFQAGADMRAFTDSQIDAYAERVRSHALIGAHLRVPDRP